MDEFFIMMTPPDADTIRKHNNNTDNNNTTTATKRACTTQRWYADFCAAVSPDTLATIAVYAASMHPFYMGLENNAEALAVLQRCLRPQAVNLAYLRASLALLREGMRHTLGAPIPASLVELAREDRVRDFMRAYHSYAALRFQRRMRAHPELLSATVRVLVQGPFFHARISRKSPAACRRVLFFTGHSLYDLLVRADPRTLPSAFPTRYPEFREALQNELDKRRMEDRHVPQETLSHRVRLQSDVPPQLEDDIDAAVQYSLLYQNRYTDDEDPPGCDFYEPHGLDLRTTFATALAALRHDDHLAHELAS